MARRLGTHAERGFTGARPGLWRRSTREGQGRLRATLRRNEKARESWSYSGEVWTGADGRAVVVLPPFVRAHRAGFEYELEPLGSLSAAVVEKEIVENRFTIVTDKPHVKVAWRVTALRDRRT